MEHEPISRIDEEPCAAPTAEMVGWWEEPFDRLRWRRISEYCQLKLNGKH